MKKKLDKKLKEKVLVSFRSFLSEKCDIDRYEKYLIDNYCDIIVKENTSHLDIINDFYVDDNIYNTVNVLSEEGINIFVRDNYKELLISNIGLNTRYDPEKSKFGPKYENLVKNGTLVFKLQCVIDFNVMNSKAVSVLNKLDEDIMKTEKDLSKQIDIPVRIIYSEKYLKKKND